MNLLDESFPADQRLGLRQWRIPHRQLGSDLSYPGVKDDNIIPVLHRIRWVTFFTQDGDFFTDRLCHRSYCLVWLDVREDDAAVYVRRFLQHNLFAVGRKRMGVVARAHHRGIHFWARGQEHLKMAAWA